MTHDTSGPTWRVPLAHYDPDSSFSRTWLVTSLWGWERFSGTLPRWGMTRRGELFELPTPGPPMGGPASSSSLLPTPNTQNSRESGLPRDHRADMTAALARLLPTPVADNSRGLPQPGTAFASLPNAVLSLLPTPTVNDMGAGKTVEQWDEWTDRMRARHGNGNGHGPSLEIEALRLLPTPLASDGEKGGPNQRGGSGDLRLSSAVQLLPTPSVADAMGGHLTRSGSRSDELLLPGVAKALANGDLTDQPSADGKPSSDDQLPGQLSLDATADPD